MILSYPLLAELTVSQIEEMVKRIQSKRVSEYEIDFLKIPSPLDGIKKIVDKNITKTVLLERTQDINFVLNAIVNNHAYINGKWYKKGESIQGFVLREIFPDHVTLKKDRKHVKVYLVKKKGLKIKLTTKKSKRGAKK